MEYGAARRVVVEGAAGDEPTAVYEGSCRLIGLFCSSVGQTGLPTDPPDEGEGEGGEEGGGEGGGGGVNDDIPRIESVEPRSGPDGTAITVTGTNFGEQGPESKLTIGAPFNMPSAEITSWSDTEIQAVAIQNTMPPDIPMPVMVTTDAGSQSGTQPAPGFTFVVNESRTRGGDPRLSAEERRRQQEAERRGDDPPEEQDEAVRVRKGPNYGPENEDDAVRVRKGVRGSPDDQVAGAGAGRARRGGQDEVNDEAGKDQAARTTRRSRGEEGDGEVEGEGEAEGKGRARKGKATKGRRGKSGEDGASAGAMTFPTFESGAGIMLTNASGSKILVGPFEVQPGRLYPMPMIFPDGLAVIANGALDVTFMLDRVS
jgi:hypothetical protein